MEIASVGLFLISFTQADRLLGKAGLLPLKPSWIFLLIALPLAGCALLRDFSSSRGGRRTVALLVGSMPVVIPFAAIAAIALLWSMHPTANWSRNGLHILLVPFDFTVFFAFLLVGSMATIRARLSQIGIAAGSLMVITVIVDVLSPGFFSNQMSRAAGLAENANSAAFLILSAACLALTYGRSRWRDLIIFGLSGLAVLMTFSRAGLLLFLSLLAVYSLILGTSHKALSRRRLLLPVALALVVLIAGLGVARLLASLEVGVFSRVVAQQRIEMLTSLDEFGLDDDSRLSLLRTYGELISAAPFAGYGTGYSYSRTYGPHNHYFQTWTNLGLLGLLAYCAILLGALALFIAHRWSPGIVYIAVLSGWSVFSHGVLEQRSVPMMLGLLTAAAVCDRRSRSADSTPSTPTLDSR